MAEYWRGRASGAALVWYEFNEVPLKWLLSFANVLRNDGLKQGFTLLAKPVTREYWQEDGGQRDSFGFFGEFLRDL